MSIDPSAPIYPEKDVDTLRPIEQGSYVIPEEGGFPIGVVNPADDQQAEVDITMLPGVPGQRGPRGPMGPPGNGAMQYSQIGASALWQITHSLGFKPNVRIQDSAGTDVEGDVHYSSNSVLEITFSRPISGVAYLS